MISTLGPVGNWTTAFASHLGKHACSACGKLSNTLLDLRTWRVAAVIAATGIYGRRRGPVAAAVWRGALRCCLQLPHLPPQQEHLPLHAEMSAVSRAHSDAVSCSDSPPQPLLHAARAARCTVPWSHECWVQSKYLRQSKSHMQDS
jgi:hypothetical protein